MVVKFGLSIVGTPSVDLVSDRGFNFWNADYDVISLANECRLELLIWQ